MFFWYAPDPPDLPGVVGRIREFWPARGLDRAARAGRGAEAAALSPLHCVPGDTSPTPGEPGFRRQLHTGSAGHML